MPKQKDKAQLTNESFYQQFCFAGFPKYTKKASNAYEKLQMPLKGIMNPKIATPSSNPG